MNTSLLRSLSACAPGAAGALIAAGWTVLGIAALAASGGALAQPLATNAAPLRNTPPLTARPERPSLPTLPADALLRRLVESGEAYSAETERNVEGDIGRVMAGAVLEQQALHDDVRLQTYVNQLGRWLSLESTRPELPWTFGVLDSRHAMSWSAPGGYVFVSFALLSKLDTEAELAAVLAHEIVHVTQKHALSTLARKATAQPIASLLDLSRDMAEQGPSDAAEISADLQTVVLLTRTGFNPNALAEAIKRTSPYGAGTTFVSALMGPDALTRRRLASLKHFMGTRFSEYSDKRSPRIAQRLTQMTAPQPPADSPTAATQPTGSESAPALQ